MRRLGVAMVLALWPCAAALAQTDARELAFWEAVKDTKNCKRFQLFIDNYPSSKLRPLAEAEMEDMSCGGASGDSFSDLSTFRDFPEGPEMVVIPAGEFLIGSPQTEKDRDIDEGPQTKIRLRKFAIAKHEVTNAQWAACVRDKACPELEQESWNTAPDHPVLNVSWNDAQSYMAQPQARQIQRRRAISPPH